MNPPSEIKYSKASRVLTVAFDDARHEIPAELLRVYSPSAEVRGHGGPIKPVPGKAGVGIRAIEPIGNYAVRLVFDDGHDTGIYSWPVLDELGRARERLWDEYLQRLEAAGLARDS